MVSAIYRHIKAGRGALIGNAAEHFVVGELLRRGFIAGLAPRNAADFDVVVMNGPKSVNVRVKAKTPASYSWAWNARPDGSVIRNIVENDVTVMVDLGLPGDSPRYHIALTRDVDQRLRDEFDNWVGTPGKNGQQRDPRNRVRRFTRSAQTEQFLQATRDQWDVITDLLRD